MGYKITPIDGDLVVGRNAEVGGNMDIHGNARVAGSLKVEGFLDAPHIKGAAKGLFNSVEELTREYPNPRLGWFAIVLDATNKEMGILYKAENRGWVATTDEARPYEFIMDSINVFASKDEVAEITAEVSKALDEKVDKSSIVHTTGDSAEKVMSQESISKSIVANASVFKTFDSSVQMADIALAFIKDIRIYTDTPKEISLFLLSRNGNDYKMQFAYTDEAEGVYYMQYNGPINDDCCVISGNGFLAHIYVNKNALPDGVQVSNMGRKAFVLSSSCFFTNDRLLGLDAKVAENTQKIDELKDCFTVDTVVEDFSVEKDTYIDYYNGATKSFEGYELRKYPVEEGTTISVCVEGVTFDAAAAMYAIYSDDSVMDETTLLNLGPALSPANNGKHTLNIPAGSRVLALSVWKQDTTVAYSVTESRSSVEGYVDSRANKAAAVETARAKKAEEELNTRIDKSLGSVTFSLTEGGVYVDQWDNKGNAKGESTRIPTADIGGMGFMSRGDKTYLDSLNNEGTLEVEFTESNQMIRLSGEGYDDIPKGVHIQIKSDTITELIGLYQGTDGVIEQTLVDGTITEGVIFRIKNKEETGNVTIKYTGQIAELLSRLQGMSEESSASTDPFRFLGEFKDPNGKDLHDALNNLHSTNKADGYEGVWRFNVQGKPSTLYNLALDYTKDKWLQGLITIYSPNSNPDYVFGLNNKINILYRIHERTDDNENGKWSTWRSITQDNADAIAAETARAKKAEEELRQTVVTKKRNYIHATSTEAYIISKYNNKYDIIIHFAKTLKNELYTIESVYLVNNTNTELSTDINREPVYRFCQQQTSDMIGPVSVRTGIDGLSWVGGNHLHKTQDSGVKTAKTLAFAVNADDTAIGNGRMYAEKITIRVKNEIYDPNVEPAAGADILSSRLIEEFVTYTVDKGEVLVSVEHRYLKDIYVGTYYGMQSMFSQYSSIITNTLTDWKDEGTSSILKDDAKDFNRFSQKDANGYYQNTILLPYGIGKHQLIKDGAQVFIESGSKAYHVLIKSQNIKANDVLSWMGIYSWKTPIIDNEYNYIYTYSDNNGENISVTAKQVYENKIVPVFPSLANKAYESDGIVKVDDIIGYNIVLSTENVGSSIIRVDNGIRVATTENDGLMSAEDKEVVTSLTTIDYAEQPYRVGLWIEQDGKVVEGASSIYARYNPINIHGGQKIEVTAAAGSNNKALFITDKDGNIIYSKLTTGTTMYAPDGAAMLYITSSIAAYSCVVYGVYDTNSYRAQKLDKLIGENITFPLNGYYDRNGVWYDNNSYYCTEKIAVSENSGVETNATYIACWDINGKWLGRNTENDGSIWEGTKYIAIFGQSDGYYLRFNSDYCNIPTQEDIHNISRRIDSLTGEIKGRVGLDVDTLNVIDLTNNNVTVIEGVAGEAGARYSVPITVKGGYGITMKFKMPDDLHTAVYERELISFGTRNHNTTNGFSVDIKSVLPTNDLSQVLCKSSLGFYPTNSKTNNYAGRVDVQGRTEREFVGDVAFSLRYTGSLEGNEDIAYTLGENALRIYHTTTDVDVLNVPYPEDNFITSLLDAVNAHSGIVEAVGYCAENLSLDNIIKCSAIPLVGTYEGTTDAFPSFVLLKDDSWHTLEVRFDASKGKGVDMIAGYIDGRRFYHVSDGYKLYGDGYFKSELIFGCDGVAVKSIKVAPTLKSEIPNIVALCQHSINGDEKFNSTVTSGTNLSVTYGRTEELLRVFKKYGFKYVTSEQINGYLRRGEVLPHNSFTIIHDDYHYMRENAEKEYARDIRKLYLRNGIKASFGLIPAYLTDEEIAEVEKDKDVFEFLIHDDYSLSSSKGYQAIADRIANNISNFKSKLYTSNIWVYTGGVFDANTKMMLQASGISIAYYTSGTTTSGGICDASDRLGLPRLYCNDTGTTISELEEILSNLVKH